MEIEKKAANPAVVSPAFLDSFGLDIQEADMPNDMLAPAGDEQARVRKAPVLCGAWEGNIMRVKF